MQYWRKLGLIFATDKNYPWMHSHAAVPFVTNIDNNLITVFFSSRDQYQCSSICSLKFDINSLSVDSILDYPLLTKGELGLFDDNGVMGCCTIRIQNDILMYYIGWNLGVTVPFRNSIGVAKSHDNGKSFYRLFKGPVLDRSREEPHFVASNCVIKDNDLFKIWYLSCTDWLWNSAMNQATHKYHIKYAESHDGITWNRKGHIAIDYKDNFEYAISVPRVIRDGESYKMWFSSRASENASTYRIRYAVSRDGINWHREKNDMVLDVSEQGWDSEMVCYPFIFDHNNTRYMLYNGNGYGKTGFGLAVLDN